MSLQEEGNSDAVAEKSQIKVVKEGRSKDWSYVAMRQGMPRFWPETTRRETLGERHGWLLPEFPERCNPADALISDSDPLYCKEIRFCCFKTPSLCYFVAAALSN